MKELPPKAARAYNDRARSLLNALSPTRETESSGSKFRSDFHTVAHITQANIVEIKHRKTLDPETNEISRISLFTDDGIVHIESDNLDQLNKLSHDIQRNKTFSYKVSREFVTTAVLDWLYEQMHDASEEKCSDFLQKSVADEIGTFEVAVPLANLALEKEISFGKIKVKPISREQMDNWLQQSLSGRDQESAAQLTAAFDQNVRKLQGLAAVVVALRAERQLAVNKALERADEVASIFRLMHPANMRPTDSFQCVPIGKHHEESYMVLIERDKRFEGRSEGMLNFPTLLELDAKRVDILDELSEPSKRLLERPHPNTFSEQVFAAITLYTRSTLATKPAEKLVLIFAALESLLLKDRGEPIKKSDSRPASICSRHKYRAS